MSSPIDMHKLLEWASERWEKRSTIAIVIFFLALAFIWKFSGSDIAELSLPEILLTICVCLLVYGFWHIAVRLPKCPRNYVGVAIAIAAESKEEHRVLASDFLAALRNLLNRGDTTHRFCLVEIPQHHATRINTIDDAIRVGRGCRCHFMIWGTVKLRTLAGKQQHMLNLEGMVSHSAIPQQLQRRFSEEFGELFPRNIHIDRENDVMSLEFTSEWIDCVARYIIGIAATLSGDIDYAQSLFITVLQNTKLKDCPLPAIRKIRQRTPVRLGELHAFRAALAYRKWRDTQDPALLGEVRMHLTELSALHPANYRGRLLRAIYHFVAERNIEAAEAEVKKCRDIRDATWRYSYAFLLAYKGELRKARRMYKNAFAHECADSVPCETEEFILRVLQEEPDKVQLRFCLGLINWHAKQDKTQAVQDFTAFLAASGAERFPEEQRLARTYIGTLEGEILKEGRTEPN